MSVNWGHGQGVRETIQLSTSTHLSRFLTVNVSSYLTLFLPWLWMWAATSRSFCLAPLHHCWQHPQTVSQNQPSFTTKMHVFVIHFVTDFSDVRWHYNANYILCLAKITCLKKNLSVAPISRDSAKAQNIWNKQSFVLNIILSLVSTSYVTSYNASITFVTEYMGEYACITSEHFPSYTRDLSIFGFL